MTLRWPRSRLPQTLIAAAIMLAALLAVGACAPLTLINSLVPGDTYRAERDIAYGDLPRQRLDVYVPAGLPATKPFCISLQGLPLLRSWPRQ